MSARGLRGAGLTTVARTTEHGATARTTTISRLLVFIPARRHWPNAGRGLSPSTVLSYIAIAAGGSVGSGRAPIGALPKARAVDVVFDTLDVYTASVEAPPLPEGKLRQALPNLLEDRLLADPAACHFAAAAADGPEAGLLAVAAIDRTTLQRTLETFDAARISVRAAYGAGYTVPEPDGPSYSVRVIDSAPGSGRRDDGSVGDNWESGAVKRETAWAVLRVGRDQACALELEDGAHAALALAKQQFGIRRLRAYGPQSAALTAAAAALELDLQWAPVVIEAAGPSRLVNLLQGDFAPGGNFRFSGQLLNRLTRAGAWRVPAAWLAVCAGIAIGGLNLYWLQLQERYAALRASMHRHFKDGFPHEPEVYALEQARRAVAELRARAGQASATDFSALNAQALQVLTAAPAGIVAAIEYADGAYRIRFKPGSADDAALRNALQARALAAGLVLRFGADGSARLAPFGNE